MIYYQEFKNKALEDPELKAAYDELQPEFDIIQALIDARTKKNMTQKELAEVTGISQSNISKIENGSRNPSLAMLKKLAAGMGMRLRLEFEPIQQ